MSTEAYRSRSNSGGRVPRPQMGTKARSASASRRPEPAPVEKLVDFQSENSSDEDSTDSNKIKVYVRIRPSYLRNRDSIRIVCADDNKAIFVTQGTKQMKFACDQAFEERASQREVYENLGKNLLPQLIDGRNVCMFAYGQTGSGKTHSILGTEDDPGVLPRFCRDLFEQAAEDLQKKCVTIEATFYELYMEKAYDLLSPTRTQLRLRGADTVYLEGLTHVRVTSYRELAAVLEAGVTKRATTATLVNEFSSRSHAIFQIIFRRHISEVVTGVERKGLIISNCYFVDLAGSERLDMIGTGNRAETLAINCSLLALQKVIWAKAAPISTFVNYRESLLTRLLKECFGGNSVTSLLATVNPELQYTGLSINTLRFASKAALVRQTPMTNIDPFVSAVQGLKAENEEMRVELEKLRSSSRGLSVGSSSICRHHEAPCLVELFEDGSLNVWFKVTAKGVQVAAPADSVPALVCYLTEGVVFAVAKVDWIVVNGEFIVKDKEVQLNHRDRISLGGMRFFVFCAHNDAEVDLPLPTYEGAKLEYVEGTISVIGEKLKEEARCEFEQDRDEVVRQLNKELEKTKEELDAIKVQMAENKKDERSNLDLVERKLDLENCAEETRQFQRDLGEKLNEARALFVDLQTLDSVEKTELIELEAKVSTINNILESFKKREMFMFKLVQNASSEVERVCVRLLNLKSRMFADLSYEEFGRVFDSIVEIYHNSSMIPDGLNDIESILYGGNWQWKQCVAGRRSNIFSTALYNSMCDVARSRRSSVAKLQRNLSRKSILTETIEHAMNAKKVLTQYNLDTQLQLIELHQDDKDHHTKNRTLTHNLLKWARNVSETLQNANEEVENCRRDASKQRVGIVSADHQAVHAVHQFMLAVTTLETAVLCSNRAEGLLEVVVSEMLNVMTAILKDRDRWVYALHSKSESSSFFVNSMNKKLNMMFALIGRYAFVSGDKFPRSEFSNSANNDATDNSSSSPITMLKAREMFNEGLVKSIDEACATTAEIRGIYEACDDRGLSAVILLLCNSIEILHVAMKAEKELDERIVFDVMRVLLYIRNKLMQKDAESRIEEMSRRLIDLRTTMSYLIESVSHGFSQVLREVSGSVRSAIGKIQIVRSGVIRHSRSRGSALMPHDKNKKENILPSPSRRAVNSMDASLEGQSMVDFFIAKPLDTTKN